MRDTVPNALLGNIRHVDRIPQLERKSHRTPVVVLEGEDCTRDLNERVETSFATGVIANKSSKSPAGGGIIKEQLRYTGLNNDGVRGPISQCHGKKADVRS